MLLSLTTLIATTTSSTYTITPLFNPITLNKTTEYNEIFLLEPSVNNSNHN
ncbi:19029_t:CDS:2 [Cetraspora pellucida]|uniref:19029_t:CDS:1 n=1 Tax=Cetraspora pellucida TaxID=1433469 RepID=A0A9N9BLB0_9GLOM|nr:19029_t:CDS:2 [Cetraspora pellucida]